MKFRRRREESLDNELPRPRADGQAGVLIRRHDLVPYRQVPVKTNG